MRVFTAIEIPDDIVESIRRLQSQLPKEDCKLTKPKTFHITLQFLGDVDEEHVNEIKKTLSNIVFKKFSLTIDRIGFFPDEKYLKVVWLGLKEHDFVKDLVSLMNQKMDFKPDKRFHAHITIARVKFVKDPLEFVQKVKSIKLPESSIKFKAKSFKLVKSELTPKGPVYSDLEEFELVD